ncbi:hypothetical protein [Streptobacillus moniliformis]|uniref:hypothetical protein n=1 Tax=Streptobacillus moniliformis TaxID=34105 RepID=UPI0007E4C1C0|nr:hypothetical protein [Streptobacillus moniliformis]
MKEFYLKKNNNNEILFFYRYRFKDSISKEEWIKSINENKTLNKKDSQKTFKELLLFLNIKNKIIHKLDDVEITVWKGNEYKITRIKMKNDKKSMNDMKFSISDDNYICTENIIYIINKNNNINERFV